MSESMPEITETNHDKDRGAMGRTILQGFILAAILWVGNSLNSQGTSIAKIQVQIENLQLTIAGLPNLGDRVTKLESNQAEIIRRQNNIDAWRENQGGSKVKGWTR